MGYRLALRKLMYPTHLRPGGRLPFTSRWESKGVAPCYRRFRFAFRLKGQDGGWVLASDADIRQWLPGDAVHDSAVTIPAEVGSGEYKLQVGIVGVASDGPTVRLAIAGAEEAGWYTMGPAWVDS